MFQADSTSVQVCPNVAATVAWGTDAPADFDNDGLVGITDLLELLARWGSCE